MISGDGYATLGVQLHIYTGRDMGMGILLRIYTTLWPKIPFLFPLNWFHHNYYWGLSAVSWDGKCFCPLPIQNLVIKFQPPPTPKSNPIRSIRKVNKSLPYHTHLTSTQPRKRGLPCAAAWTLASPFPPSPCGFPSRWLTSAPIPQTGVPRSPSLLYFLCRVCSCICS